MIIRKGPPLVAAFDLLSCLLLVFVILTLTSAPKKTQPAIETMGSYAIQISWADNSNDDVDLWVEDPHKNVVWYASQDEGLMHLENDDLGTGISGTLELSTGEKVVTPKNGERTVIRGLVPGEYIVNLDMYTKRDPGPTVVMVKLWSLRGDDHPLHTQYVLLAKDKQEETAFRFTVNPDGSVSNYNRLFKTLVYRGALTFGGSGATEPSGHP